MKSMRQGSLKPNQAINQPNKKLQQKDPTDEDFSGVTKL